ncbi:MAG: winged helix-turn-helix transcriptional regulator [Nitrospiraceae bacterium]|nr:winged helix-turn-helix transcriptional regulator [Nitrospiraceae bacterium]
MGVSFSLRISRISKKGNPDLNDEIFWFAESLGLVGNRDKDKSCFRIFIELLKVNPSHKGLSSDELAVRLNLTRGTVIHHLSKLESSQIVVKRDNKYFINSDSLESLVDRLSYEVLYSLKELKQTAKKIDFQLGLRKKQD